jgi:CDP-diacylglycerol---serine O-phosphatidyltransferase
LQHRPGTGASSGARIRDGVAGSRARAGLPKPGAADTLAPMDEQPLQRPRGRGIYLLPNLFTTGGLFGGFFAIIAASQGRFEAACVAIFVAAILDGLDGRVARLTNTQSEFGVQYDSLADLVSFGMAPALVMYHWALVALKLDGATLGKVGWLAAFLYAACAALRLARFNSQVGKVDKRWFIGLASPAAAGLMASFVWTCHDLDLSGDDLRYAALAVTIVAGLLMVSGLRYNSFKGGRGAKSDRVPFFALLIAVAVIIALVIDPPKTLLVAGVLYALSGPALWFKRRKAATDDTAEPSP